MPGNKQIMYQVVVGGCGVLVVLERAQRFNATKDCLRGKGARADQLGESWSAVSLGLD